MKTKLLKKTKGFVKLVNYHGMPAGPKDKLVTVSMKDVGGNIKSLVTAKGKVLYTTYNKALGIRKDLILSLAKDLNKKSFIWHVFH